MVDVESGVKKIVAAQIGFVENAIKLTDNFHDDLGTDSLDDVEIIMMCEEEFNVSISDEEAEKLFTVQAAVDLIKSKLR